MSDTILLLVVATAPGVSLFAEAAGKAPASKQVVRFAAPKEQPVRATLVAERTSVQPGGATRIGVKLDIADGWHIYGKEPGDAGIPTSVTWTSLPGVHFGPLMWPPAEAFVDPGNIRTFGYSKRVVLASEVSYVARESVPELPITGEVRWLACKEICLPGEATLQLNLPVKGSEPARSPDAPLFEPAAR